MSFEIVLRREAQIDLDEIFIWYEEQKVGLGFEFLKEFENTINKVSHNPHYASCIEADARATSLKKFPYQVIFRTDEIRRQIRIIAIIHLRRNPEWFRQRLGE